jgi:hypothetical protein
MKKYGFSLILGAVIFTTNPLFAMAEKDETGESKVLVAKSPFMALDRELHVLIAGYLSPQQLGVLGLLNNYWHTISEENDLWVPQAIKKGISPHQEALQQGELKGRVKKVVTSPPIRTIKNATSSSLRFKAEILAHIGSSTEDFVDWLKYSKKGLTFTLEKVSIILPLTELTSGQSLTITEGEVEERLKTLTRTPLLAYQLRLERVYIKKTQERPEEAEDVPSDRFYKIYNSYHQRFTDRGNKFKIVPQPNALISPPYELDMGE